MAEARQVALRGMALCVVVALAVAGTAQAGVAFYWPLDDGAGATAANAVTGAPDADVAAGAAWTTTTPPALPNTSALAFDHTSTSYAEVTDLTTLAPTFANPFTLSLWARSDAAALSMPGDVCNMFDFGSAHSKGVGLLFNRNHVTFDSGKICAYYNSTPLASTQDGQANTWYHVALTHDGTDLTLYVDGAAVDSKAVPLTTLITSPTPTGVSGPLTIGNQSKGRSGRGWDGAVSDVAVWSQALPADQIADLAAGVSPLVAGRPSDGDTWVFQDEGDSTQNPGPWKREARWRYMENYSATTHTYTDLAEFTDFTTYDSGAGQWQTGSTSYPSVRIANGTLHPSNTAPAEGKAVIAWEANWSGVAEATYSLTGGSTGQQFLHWDASESTMNVLDPRTTGNVANATAYARVDPGDHLLLVVDRDTGWGNDRVTVAHTITAGSTTLPQIGDAWVFESEQSATQNPGPWKNCARWHYMKSDLPYDTTYTDLNADFETLDNISGGQWRRGTNNYPNVRATDATLHPGHTATDGQAVVAWEAQWDGFVDINYRAWNGTVGTQLLQWDASAAEMRVLQERRTYSGSGGTGQLNERTRIERGDHILFVCDSNNGYGGDRVSFRQSITASAGPVPGDCWSFAADASTTYNPTIWDNSARWHYMTSFMPIDHAYASLADFAHFDEYSGQWQIAGDDGYPSVRLGDLALHPETSASPGQVVVAWEADFGEVVFYSFEPEQYYPGSTSVNYQLLHWDASASLMEVLEPRTFLPNPGALINGSARVEAGDYLLFVLDHDGDGNLDRTYLNAQVCVAPEPTSLGLLAIGGLALLRRRRRS